uniref:Uncharacterized protein n=1 Tax=Arundo donax TaxID=35708 RepID=A0A0A9ERX4_ARUDO
MYFVSPLFFSLASWGRFFLKSYMRFWTSWLIFIVIFCSRHLISANSSWE